MISITGLSKIMTALFRVQGYKYKHVCVAGKN
jgi:hypothetical protein